MNNSGSISLEEEEKERDYNMCFLIKLVTTAAVGGFLFGYDTGVIAGAQLYFKDTWPDIKPVQVSLVVSLALIGAAIGALFSGIIADKLGRKKVIIFADCCFTFGAIMQAVAPTIPILMIGRFIVGVGVEVASMIVPLYIAEIAPVEIRGKLVSVNNFTITFG